jgi:RNA recognition motif-containing protein
MAIRLYVGNLSWGTTDDSMKQAFEACGKVNSAKIVIDRMTNKSRGFGFVEFENDEDGRKAIDMFNGKDLDGRTLTVNEARPMEQRPRSDDRPRRSNFNDNNM